MTISNQCADNTTPKLRRVAAHCVAVGGTTLEPGVVTLSNGIVTHSCLLEGEQPHTEWIGGTIEVKVGDDGCLRAYREGRQLA